MPHYRQVQRRMTALLRTERADRRYFDLRKSLHAITTNDPKFLVSHEYRPTMTVIYFLTGCKEFEASCFSTIMAGAAKELN